MWECDPGTFRVDFGPAGELVQAIAGHVTCRADDGETFELREGDVRTFPTGWHGQWTAHTRFRKVFCTFVAAS